MPPASFQIEGKPSRIITLYIPAVFGLLGGFANYDTGYLSWQQQIAMRLVGTMASFCFSWPFVLAFHHGFCFFRSVFARGKVVPRDL